MRLPLYIYIFFRVDAILNLSMYKISYAVQVYTYASNLLVKKLTVAVFDCWKAKVDIIVVLIHFGHEHYRRILPYQFRTTKHLMSLGVQVIIGAHPHVIQQHCLHDNKLVAYSLGNFLFHPTRPISVSRPVIRKPVNPDIWPVILLSGCCTFLCTLFRRIQGYIKITSSPRYIYQFSPPICWTMYWYYKEKLLSDHFRVLTGSARVLR